MAYWCIDPVDGNDGTGSSQATQALAEASAFKTWGAVTFAAGDTYLQKRGTTSTAAINLNVTGTSANKIVFDVYGSGNDYAYISASTGNGIVANGKEYVEISSFDITATNTNASGIVFFCSDTRSARGVRIRDCVCHDCGGLGIGINELPNFASYQAISDCIIEDCIAYNNSNHGISMSGNITDGSIIRGCTAYNNGIGTNAWGIYMRNRGVKVQSGAWNLVAGTVYQIDVVASSAIQTNESIVHVAATGRAGGGSTNPIFLTEGAFGSLASDEWAQLGDNLQIDIGENPDGLPIIACTQDNEGGLIENCTAYGQTDTVADGVGIGFDHTTRNATIRRCVSYNNGQDGFQLNATRHCKIEGCEAYGNVNGFQISSTGDGTGEGAPHEVYIANNYSHDNTTNGIKCIRAPKAIFKNNAIEDNSVNFEIGAVSTGVTSEYNNYYGNTTTQNTDSTDTANDPVRNSDGTPTISSPLVAAGTKWWADVKNGVWPISYTGEPFSDFDTDQGHIQSTFGPFHPKNL